MSERHDPMAYNAEEHESAARCSLPVDHRDLSMAERIGAAQAHALLAVCARMEAAAKPAGVDAGGTSKTADRAENNWSDAHIVLHQNDLDRKNPGEAAIAHALIAIDAHLELLNGILAQMLEVMKGGK